MRTYLLLPLLLSSALYAASFEYKAPRGGEVVFTDSMLTVELKCRGKSVLVELSRDGGQTFETIGTIDNKVKDRTKRNVLQWKVAGATSTNAVLRVSWAQGKKTIKQTSRVFSLLNPFDLTGPVGDIGPVGATGPQGSKGDKGDKGDTGAVGPQGPQGPQGLAGADGSMGPQGIQGDPGPQGPQGVAGATGAKGDKGDTGAAGPTGPTGAKGDTGNTGPAGPAGPQGVAGVKGDKGDQGLTGPAGPAGPAGPQGPPGSQGPIGPNGAPTISYINTSSTAAAVLDSARHSGTLVINDPNIRGAGHAKGRSQIFLSFTTTSNSAEVVSLSLSNLQDGQVTVNIKTQNYSIKTTDSVDYQIVNSAN